MTEAEELELLELEEEEANAKGRPAPKQFRSKLAWDTAQSVKPENVPEPSQFTGKEGKALSRGISKLSFNAGPRIEAGVDALMGGDYAKSLEGRIAAEKDAEATHPVLTGAAETLPFFLAPQMGPLGWLATGLATGASRSEQSPTENPLGFASDVAREGLYSMGGSMLPAAARGLASRTDDATAAIANAINPILRRGAQQSPASQTLSNYGIRTQTLGQRNPRSEVAQLEEASSSLPLVDLTGRREMPKQEWMNAALSEAAPPGVAGSGAASNAGFPLQGSPQQRMGAMREGYNEAYDAVRGAELSQRAQNRPVNSARLQQALPLAANARTTQILQSEADRAGVERFLQDQASIVQRQSGPQGPVMPRTLLQIRSNIREARSGFEPGDPRRQLLDRAEQTINARLQYSLPASELRQLEGIDSQYRNFATLRDMLGRNAAVSEFTPFQLGAATARNSGKGATASGNTGNLGELAQAGHEVFQTRIPQTAARMIAGSIPGVPRFAMGPAIAWANAPGNQARALRLMQQGLNPPSIEGLLDPALSFGERMGPAVGLGLSEALRNKGNK